MSEENVELIKALYPPTGTDVAQLFRDEDDFARLREAVSPLLTDDFESAFAFPGQTRTHAGLEGYRRTGSTGSSRGRHTEPPWTS